MRRIVLFRFHNYLNVCINRLNLLHKFNPEIKIYGIYGGDPLKINGFRRLLNHGMENIFDISDKDKNWKWENGDLAVLSWFKKIGNNIPFDILHIIEWDMLILKPIKEVYAHIPNGSIGLTGLIPLREVENKWDWTSEEPYKSRWDKLLKIARDKYNYNQNPYADIFGGACFSKIFLERYSKIEIPEICHDELRTPLFAQILGIKMYDTKLANIWGQPSDEEYFNANDKEIKLNLIQEELKKRNGRRVFHPYRKIFPYY